MKIYINLRRLMGYLLVTTFVLLVMGQVAHAQDGPRALVVIAHPDDESILSVTIYKIAKEQHGTVDLFVITNGEAGYRYSALAEQYYNCKLTDQQDARLKLPAIRRKELKEAGGVLGISHYYFGGQPDSHFSLDEHEPLDTSWHVDVVKKQLRQLLARNHYDFVFCLLPEGDTHAGHKAATLLALNAVAEMPVQSRPLILGAALRDKADSVRRFNVLGSYTITRTKAPLPGWVTDRTVRFSYLNRINYKVVANWELAAHKSQGFTQMSMNDGDLEEFWYFDINRAGGINETTGLFERLKQSPYNVQGQAIGKIP